MSCRFNVHSQGSTPVINVCFQNHYKQHNWWAAQNKEDWRQPGPIMRETILHIVSLVSNQQMASDCCTKAMQYRTNIYNNSFEETHRGKLFSVSIMSDVCGICGGLWKDRLPTYWLNLLMLSESDTKRLVDTERRQGQAANRALQWHLSSSAHCERDLVVNKFNDAHWKRDVWDAAVTIWWLRALLIPTKLHRLSK